MDVTEKRQHVKKAQEEMPTHPEGSNAQSDANRAMQVPHQQPAQVSHCGTTNLKSDNLLLDNCGLRFPSNVLCDGIIAVAEKTVAKK